MTLESVCEGRIPADMAGPDERAFLAIIRVDMRHLADPCPIVVLCTMKLYRTVKIKLPIIAAACIPVR